MAVIHTLPVPGATFRAEGTKLKFRRPEDGCRLRQTLAQLITQTRSWCFIIMGYFKFYFEGH